MLGCWDTMPLELLNQACRPTAIITESRGRVPVRDGARKQEQEQEEKKNKPAINTRKRDQEFKTGIIYDNDNFQNRIRMREGVWTEDVDEDCFQISDVGVRGGLT